MRQVYVLVAVAAAGCSATSPGSEPAPRIDWHGPFSSIQAHALTIDAGDEFTVPDASSVMVDGEYVDDNHVEMRGLWNENGVEMRVLAKFAQDDTNWWIDELWHYNGEAGAAANWVIYPGPFARTPLAMTYEGNLDIATLHLTDATISAFAPPCADGADYTIEPAQIEIPIRTNESYSAAVFLRDSQCKRIDVPANMHIEWTVADTAVAMTSPMDSVPLTPFAARQNVSYSGVGSTTLSIDLKSGSSTVAKATIPVEATYREP